MGLENDMKSINIKYAGKLGWWTLSLSFIYFNLDQHHCTMVDRDYSYTIYDNY